MSTPRTPPPRPGGGHHNVQAGPGRAPRRKRHANDDQGDIDFDTVVIAATAMTVLGLAEGERVALMGFALGLDPAPPGIAGLFAAVLPAVAEADRMLFDEAVAHMSLAVTAYLDGYGADRFRAECRWQGA